MILSILINDNADFYFYIFYHYCCSKIKYLNFLSKNIRRKKNTCKNIEPEKQCTLFVDF